MNLTSGDCLWTNINKIPNKYLYLSDDIECDVVVIGGGITGAICAYYLCESGVNTVLVDKNIVGYGSTSASTSILQYEVDYDLIGLKGMIGIENAVKAFKLCEKAVKDIYNIVNTLDMDCSFRLCECLYYTSKKSEIAMLKEEYKLRDKYGFDVCFLDKNNSKDKFSFPIEAGIFSKSGAGEIDPYKFTHALINESIKKGLKLFENTEVVNIDNSTSEVVLTTKNKHKIKSKKIVIATGFEAPKYIDDKIVKLLRSFTVVSKPIKEVQGWYNRCIIRDTTNPYFYLRNTHDNRIIMGGVDEEVGGKNSKISNLTGGEKVCKDKYSILTNKIQELFPSIDNLQIEYAFNGLFGDTKDGLPYFGEYKNMPNCYFCLGYGSNGILYAILGGQIITQLYHGNYPKEMSLYKFDR